MKLLPISGCQAVLVVGPSGARTHRLCGATSVAVIRYDDGQERFVCSAHKPKTAAPGPAWRLHRREVAAVPSADDSEEPRGRGRAGRQRAPLTQEARKKIADGQRARWERIRRAKGGSTAERSEAHG